MFSYIGWMFGFIVDEPDIFNTEQAHMDVDENSDDVKMDVDDNVVPEEDIIPNELTNEIEMEIISPEPITNFDDTIEIENVNNRPRIKRY